MLRLVWCFTDALAILHWLRFPQRVDYKVAVMAFRVLHGLAPPYLDQQCRPAWSPPSVFINCSSTSYQLHVLPHRLVSAGRRSFPVAAAILWNSLPSDVQSSTSLSVFQQWLKTFLFHKSFPDVLLPVCDYVSMVFVITCSYFSRVNNSRSTLTHWQRTMDRLHQASHIWLLRKARQ